jgi:NAD-dependent SIR2 family protein deacetylase
VRHQWRPGLLQWYRLAQKRPRVTTTRSTRVETAVQAARECSLIIVVGTSGAARLPVRLARLAIKHGVRLIDVNIEAGLLSHTAAPAARGTALRGPASEVVAISAPSPLDTDQALKSE